LATSEKVARQAAKNAKKNRAKALSSLKLVFLSSFALLASWREILF
jgi:hypothetical protein